MATGTQEQVAKVELAWRCFYQSAVVPRYLMEQDFRALIPQAFDRMVLQINTMVAGERVQEIRYPADWWQALRERWFPGFWLKRFPVRYHEWHVDLLYPMIQRRHVGKGQFPTISVYSSERPRSPGFLPNPPEDEDHG